LGGQAGRYGLPLAAIAAVVLLRPLFHVSAHSFVAFCVLPLLAMATGWGAGLGPALVSIAISTWVFITFFLGHGSAAVEKPPQLLLFWLECGLLCFVGLRLSAARSRSLQLTQQVKAQAEALRRSEALSRLLADQVRDHGIFRLDAEGSISTWNAGATRLTGYERSEIIGRPFSTLYPPEQVGDGLPARDLAHARRYGRFEDERIRVGRDGARRLMQVMITALYGEGDRLDGFAVVTQDITERRRAEAQQQLMLEATSVLMSSLDITTTLQSVAQSVVPRMADLCAIDLLQPTATHLGDFAAVCHVDPAKQQELLSLRRALRPDLGGASAVARALRSGRPEELGAESDSPLMAANLESFAILKPRFILCVPLSARGLTLGVITLASQSEHPGWGPDLAHAKELGRRIALAVDNAQLIHDARDAVRARDEFLAIAAHELRTPLTPLRLGIKSILQQGPVAMPQLNRRLVRMDRQVNRLTRLIEDLLDISRITSGRLELQREDVDLSAVIDDVVDRFRDGLAAAGCVIRVEHAGPVWGRWNRVRLEQVVENLLANALKYGPGRPIEIRLTEDHARVMLQVTDHGIGIAPADVERIFQRFERAVSDRNYGGFGLGLWIVRQVLDALGGEISVETRPGGGSTFMVTLPRQARADAALGTANETHPS
jgi:PAS domain S-box-containing protein